MSSSRIETDTVECYRHRADLDIVIGNPRDKSSNSMRISLKNFRSVEHNTEAAELAFTIDDSTVGTVRVQTPEHTWHVHPAAAANSRCQITVDRGANGTLDIQTKCRDLVPAARLTLEKMSQQTLQAALGKPIRCSISE